MMERMFLKKIPFIKYGLIVVFISAFTVFSLLWLLRVDDKPLLNMILAYFLNQPVN